MAFLGWWDGELRPDAWWDAELQPAAWWDTEIVDTTAGGTVNYSLSGTTGAYTLTGRAATLTYTPGVTATNYTLSGATGSYAITGRAATFKVAHTLTGATGAYAITGRAATFKVAHTLSGAAGSYALTGNTGTFSYVAGAGSTAYSLSGATGAYAITGRTASFKVAHSLSGSTGAYSLTGRAGTFSYVAGSATQNYTLSGATGSYQLTGGDATFAFSGARATFSQEVEVRRRRYYVKRDKQILIFDTAEDADAFIEAQEQADKAIAEAQRTSRRARKRLRDQVFKVADVAPVDTLEIPALVSLIGRYSIPVDLPALLAQQDWERVMQIYALAMEMQDDEDIELLLMTL